MLDLLTTLRMSFTNLKNNKMRTFLTMLGVVIGITAIISLLTIGEGVANSVINKISGLGGNRLTVSITNTATKSGFTAEEFDRFTSIDGVTGISPSLSAGKAIVLIPNETKSKYDEVYTDAQRVMGVSDDYFTANTQNVGMLLGRSITEDDITHVANVCVIGYNRWQRLYNNYNPVGETIRINNVPCTIIGVLNQVVGLDTAANNAILVPYTTATRTFGMGLPRSFDVIFRSADVGESVKAEVSALCSELLNSRGGSGYSIVDQQELADVVLTVTDLVLGMLAGIAIISLIVGGIGIMNMMLVTVTERTAEIGLRKALGARPSVILVQFLTEAIMLSLAGGVIGVLLGVGISYIASIIIGYTFTYKMSTILLAAGFSLAVGVIFGIIPARRAAKLNPIDALRST